MLTIFGKYYYLNLDIITEKCKIDYDNSNDIGPNDEDTEDKGMSINIFKYEVLKMCIDRVLDEPAINDEGLGVLGQSEFPSSFKIAFNTLINYSILIELSDE